MSTAEAHSIAILYSCLVWYMNCCTHSTRCSLLSLRCLSTGFPSCHFIMLYSCAFADVLLPSLSFAVSADAQQYRSLMSSTRVKADSNPYHSTPTKVQMDMHNPYIAVCCHCWYCSTSGAAQGAARVHCQRLTLVACHRCIVND